MLWLFVYGYQFHSATFIENKIFGGVFGYEIHLILLEYRRFRFNTLLLFVLFSFIILNFNINFKNFLDSLKK